MQSTHVASFYAAHCGNSPHQPELVGKFHSDICIVGGGLAGLTCAIELLKRGRHVVVLEAERVGWGASGRNGGFVSSGFSERLSLIEKKVGLDNARTLYRLSRGGVNYVRQTIVQENIKHIVAGTGWLKVQRHGNQDQLLRQRDHLGQNYGVELQLWDQPQLQSVLSTERYHFGLYDQSPFHINPLSYVEALKRKVIRLGGRIFEATLAQRVKGVGAGWRVHTPLGCVHCESVIMATSAYGVLNGACKSVDQSMVPVASYVITTAKLGDMLKAAIRFPGCIADTRRAGDYYRVVDQDRLLWGGHITTRREEPAHLAEMLRGHIQDVYPALGECPIEFSWSGLMGYARHKMPVIGEVKPGLWALTGFGGHGLNTTAMGGALVASGIAEGDERWKLFASYGASWNGGMMGRAVAQMEYYRLQMADRLEEGVMMPQWRRAKR
ncbi:NAD(P)/FAD-dependent oxidoreductase [Polycladidibacter stylochi]|uniref:NAD(P)/FAD-dependent oxidoreductase n=1 Tax=Polycladidibacter stylochi TaxID=1807766 RepID=UPI00082B8CB4|nr:FAD-binding oxidoreductase [Pseudovibrio stylochi]